MPTKPKTHNQPYEKVKPAEKDESVLLAAVWFYFRRLNHVNILSLSPPNRQEKFLLLCKRCMVSTISGHTMMMYLVGTLTHPFWFATAENEWQSLFWRYIPSWFTVSGKALLTDYFRGDSTFYTMRYIKAWLVPILVWSSFIFVLFSSFVPCTHQRVY
jgi:hypothetical protein